MSERDDITKDNLRETRTDSAVLVLPCPLHVYVRISLSVLSLLGDWNNAFGCRRKLEKCRPSFVKSERLLFTNLINDSVCVQFLLHKLCLSAGLLLHKLIAPFQCRVCICLVVGRGEGEKA